MRSLAPPFGSDQSCVQRSARMEAIWRERDALFLSSENSSAEAEMRCRSIVLDHVPACHGHVNVRPASKSRSSLLSVYDEMSLAAKGRIA